MKVQVSFIEYSEFKYIWYFNISDIIKYFIINRQVDNKFNIRLKLVIDIVYCII